MSSDTTEIPFQRLLSMSGGYRRDSGYAKYGNSYDYGNGCSGNGYRSDYTPRASYNNNRGDPNTARLVGLIEKREWAKWEDKEKEKKMKEEADSRKLREDETAARKKERDDFYAEMAENQKKFLTDLGKNSSSSTTPRKRPKAQSPANSSGSEDDFADYRKKLKAGSEKKKKQTVRAPVRVDEWLNWTCENSHATKVRASLGNELCKNNEIVGLGLMELAEFMHEHAKCPKKADISAIYEAESGDAPPGRWGRLDIIIGLIANLVKP